MSTPYFKVFKDTAKQWRWHLNASNGKTIADSAEGYHNLADCEAGIALVKKEAPTAVVIGDDDYKKAKS